MMDQIVWVEETPVPSSRVNVQDSSRSTVTIPHFLTKLRKEDPRGIRNSTETQSHATVQPLLKP